MICILTIASIPEITGTIIFYKENIKSPDKIELIYSLDI